LRISFVRPIMRLYTAFLLAAIPAATTSFVPPLAISRSEPCAVCPQARQSTLAPLHISALDSPRKFEARDREEEKKSSFAQRMNEIIKRRQHQSGDVEPSAITQKRKNNKPDNVFTVQTLNEFKEIVAQEKERITVVRWYAGYCRWVKWFLSVNQLNHNWNHLEVARVMYCFQIVYVYATTR